MEVGVSDFKENMKRTMAEDLSLIWPKGDTEPELSCTEEWRNSEPKQNNKAGNNSSNYHNSSSSSSSEEQYQWEKQAQ